MGKSVGDLFAPTRPGTETGRTVAERPPLVLAIAYHPDLRRVGESLVVSEEIEVSRTSGGFSGGVLADPFLSRRPLLLAADEGGLWIRNPNALERIAVGGTTLGDARHLSETELSSGVTIEIMGRVVLVAQRTFAEEAELNLGLIGGSLAPVRRQITKIADLTTPVLIRGETGTGKELVARAIHDSGPRRDEPFIAVNMSAIPPSVAASELFGHARGAFSGADRDHPGHVVRAGRGTIFLDEIAEAPSDVQPMLLRFLESGEVQPVGGAPVAAPARVVAATDAELESQVTSGRFREPLLYRLAGFEIRLPPLRERRADIGPLLVHFLERSLTATGELHRLEEQRSADSPRLWFPASLAARMIREDWPGNVRQLANAIHRLVVEHRGSDQIPDRSERSPAPEAPPAGDLREQLRIFEVNLIREALARCGFSKPKAAAELNIPYRTLVHKIKALGIEEE